MNTTEALASLESQIMNLPATTAWDNDALSRAYKEGHRDARHAAAELVSAALAQAEQAAEPDAAIHLLRSMIESDCGRLWNWPDTARETWLSLAREVVAKSKPAEQAQPAPPDADSRKFALAALCAVRSVPMHPNMLKDVDFAIGVIRAELAAPPAAQPLSEDLHTFLNAAAGEGLVLDGVDAADLYVATFPERYAKAISSIRDDGIGHPPEARLGYMDGDVA